MDKGLTVLIPNLILAGDSTMEITTSLNTNRIKLKSGRDMLEGRGNIKALSKPGGKISKWTPALIRRVEDRVKANPKQSINKLAKEFSVSDTRIRRLMKKGLIRNPEPSEQSTR